MKNQYFGDVNDYMKYGLLRLLAGPALKLGICWMLTPDDGKGDGRLIQYLHAPQVWSHYDPDLFAALQHCVLRERARSVANPRLHRLLHDAGTYAELLACAGDARRRYFDAVLREFAGCDLIFFDPDNGLEVASVPRGARQAYKYLYWDEASTAFAAGHSVLIYQHFPRVEHDRYTRLRSAEMLAHIEAAAVHWFRTPTVVYLLASRPEHAAHFARQACTVAESWRGQFDVGP